jgi:hypothetical protein
MGCTWPAAARLRAGCAGRASSRWARMDGELHVQGTWWQNQHTILVPGLLCHKLFRGSYSVGRGVGSDLGGPSAMLGTKQDPEHLVSPPSSPRLAATLQRLAGLQRSWHADSAAATSSSGKRTCAPVLNLSGGGIYFFW